MHHDLELDFHSWINDTVMMQDDAKMVQSVSKLFIACCLFVEKEKTGARK